MNKFGRKFKLTIDKNDGSGGQIIIQNPFTIEFTIERSANASMNEMQIVIYNLNKQSRNVIRQDEFFAGSGNTIKLEAGYGQLSTIFKGNIIWAYNGRQGPDVTTTVHAMDGADDVRNTQYSQTLAAGTTSRDLFTKICGAFPKLTLGAIGSYTDVFNTSVTVDDNAWNALKTYTKAAPFIDKGQIFLIQGTDYLIPGGNPSQSKSQNTIGAGAIPIISPETGLLETPMRRDSYIDVTTMFEPRITVGQLAQLQSDIEPYYNGQYKVVGVNHSGIISDAIGGNLHSRFALLCQPQAYTLKGIPVVPTPTTVPAKT